MKTWVSTLTRGNSIANFQGSVCDNLKGVEREVLVVKYIPQSERNLDLDNIVVVSQQYFKYNGRRIVDFILMTGKTIYISNSGIIDQSIGPGRDQRLIIAHLFNKTIAEIECLFSQENDVEEEPKSSNLYLCR